MSDVNFLNVFEQRVGSLFGATTQGVTAPFSFKKLAKKAAREMEAETFVINGVDTAPALYTILISSEDDITMRPLYAQLTKETSQFIEGQAQDKGYVFVGKPVVRFMADPSLKSGRFSVFAENVDAGTLNRLREEEARFLGADSSLDGGLGGAASPRAQAPGMRPTPQPQAAPLSNMESGLDVMPQEAVLEAEDAFIARGRAARQYQNVPLVGSRASQAPAPVAPVAAPEPVAAPVPVAAPAPASVASAVPAAAAGFAAGAAVQAIPGAATPQQAYAAPQPAPQTVRVAPAAPAPAASPAACLLIDRKSGRTFTASAPRTVIGRERSAGGIVIHDPNVSRSHAELSFDGQTWRIRDLNSTNGTLVNDVDVDECSLRDGDLITLGLTNLEFREN
ncbi:DUF3662 and FHA domain-containing protein [uncultured Parolsenella sp.]|uniref:DUF3662 and FHA domain-containing protein n=1 Tax=uncultured Parolsenella sp. TaxID=2083008 RepID=UPI00344FEE5D